MKYHFYNCPEPVPEGANLIAECRKLVPNAKFAAFVDQELATVEDLRKAIGLCRKCRESELPYPRVYVICAGQEAMQESQ